MSEKTENNGEALPPVTGSPILLMFKAPKRTNHFNKSQKLWIVRLSGAMAAQVRGKYRGRGRYVKSWIKWDKKGDVLPEIKEVPVTPEFYAKIRRDADSNEGYTRLLSENERGLATAPQRPDIDK